MYEISCTVLRTIQVSEGLLFVSRIETVQKPLDEEYFDNLPTRGKVSWRNHKNAGDFFNGLYGNFNHAKSNLNHNSTKTKYEYRQGRQLKQRLRR